MLLYSYTFWRSVLLLKSPPPPTKKKISILYVWIEFRIWMTERIVALIKMEMWRKLTVDLLTTGIDVPEITSLVFMRRVKSRILFEQMLGRATRLCPEIGKTHFDVYDPVGVYESFGAVCSIKPVMRNLSLTFYIESIDKIAVRLEEAAGLIINAAKELKNLR